MARYLQEVDEGNAHGDGDQPDARALRQALEQLQQQQTRMKQQGLNRQVSAEPESVALKGRGSGYNVQTAVDAEHALIVGHEVHAQTGDNDSLQMMGEPA